MSRLGQSQRVRWRTELLLRLKDKNASKDVVRGTVAQLRDEALLGNARDYTAAITALGRLTHWNEAISLYSEYAARRADNFQVPDDICHTSVVSACERGSQWAAALELLFRRPVPPAGPAVAAAIGACGKGGAWQHAVSCLEGMKASKVDLNATCYGIGVSACARNDQVDASFVLLEAALAEDLEPGLLSYTSTLSACRRLQRWESAIKIITTMKDRAIQPDAVCSSAALSFSAFSDWQGALQLLQEAKAAQLDQAKGLKERHNKAGQYLHRKLLDVAAVNAASSVCERASQWPAALCLFDELCSTSMGLAIRPDQVSFNVAISSWGQGKHWENALRILAQMPWGQTTPDAVSYTSAISACERALEWKQAVALLEAMKLQRIQPSVLCYGAAIGAGHWLTAFQLLEAMKADRLQPSTVCFNAAINACRRDHEWQHVLRLLSKMPEEAAPSIVTFNSAITCCERAFAWHAALGLMEEAYRAHQQLNVVTFGAAITACRRATQWQRAVALMEKMTLLGIQPDPECQRVVTLALMEAGRAKEASRLLREVSGTVAGEGFQQPLRADGRGELDLQNMSAEVATVTARAAIQEAATRKFKAQDLSIILNGKGTASAHVAAMVRALGLPIRLAEKPTRVLVPLRAIRAKWRSGAAPEK